VKPTQARLKEILHYDPEAGRFTWSSARKGVVVGEEAGTVNKRGYRVIGIDGRLHRANILAWIYMTGACPEQQVDHKDRNPGNNSWLNLRDVSNSKNKLNCGLQKNNTSGVKGVCWVPDRSQWKAYIGKTILGFSPDLTQAAALRSAAEQKLGV